MRPTPLGEAVDELYRVFSFYDRAPSFFGCDCCWEGKLVEERVRSGSPRPKRVVSPGGDRPLRAIRADELAELGEQILLLGGDVPLLKHYLPRLFEIAAVQGFEGGWPDISVVFDKLSEPLGGEPWWSWPEVERDAVRDFLHALWINRITSRTPVELVDDTLCAIGHADPDIDWYLDAWTRESTSRTRKNLARLLDLNAEVWEGHLYNSYWPSDDEPTTSNRARVCAWLQQVSDPRRT